MRDPIGADQFQSARLTADPLEHEMHRPGHEMSAVAGYLVGALARDVDDQSVLADARQHVVVPVEGEAERVEDRDRGWRSWPERERGPLRRERPGAPCQANPRCDAAA